MYANKPQNPRFFIPIKATSRNIDLYRLIDLTKTDRYMVNLVEMFNVWLSTYTCTCIVLGLLSPAFSLSGIVYLNPFSCNRSQLTHRVDYVLQILICVGVWDNTSTGNLLKQPLNCHLISICRSFFQEARFQKAKLVRFLESIFRSKTPYLIKLCPPCLYTASLVTERLSVRKRSNCPCI